MQQSWFQERYSPLLHLFAKGREERTARVRIGHVTQNGCRHSDWVCQQLTVQLSTRRQNIQGPKAIVPMASCLPVGWGVGHQIMHTDMGWTHHGRVGRNKNMPGLCLGGGGGGVGGRCNLRNPQDPTDPRKLVGATLPATCTCCVAHTSPAPPPPPPPIHPQTNSRSTKKKCRINVHPSGWVSGWTENYLKKKGKHM